MGVSDRGEFKAGELLATSVFELTWAFIDEFAVTTGSTANCESLSRWTSDYWFERLNSHKLSSCYC